MRAGDRRIATRLDDLFSREHVCSMLLALDGKPDRPWGVKALAKEMKVNVGGLGSLARHIERFGLVRVETKPGVGGKGAYDIWITPEGRQWIGRQRPAGVALPDPAPAKAPIRLGPRTRD